MDSSFIYDLTEHLYALDTSRPNINSLLLFKYKITPHFATWQSEGLFRTREKFIFSA